MNLERTKADKTKESEREARLSRFKALVDYDSEDDEKVDLNSLAGLNLDEYLNKVVSHLNAESKMIDLWKLEQA